MGSTDFTVSAVCAAHEIYSNNASETTLAEGFNENKETHKYSLRSGVAKPLLPVPPVASEVKRGV